MEVKVAGDTGPKQAALHPAEPSWVFNANRLPCGYSAQPLAQVGALLTAFLNEINKTPRKPG